MFDCFRATLAVPSIVCLSAAYLVLIQGYVSHTLHDVFRYSVLALEGQESRTHGAVNRANKLGTRTVCPRLFHTGCVMRCDLQPSTLNFAARHQKLIFSEP